MGNKKAPNLEEMKERYFRVLESQVVEPLRQELRELQSGLRAEQEPESADREMLQSYSRVQREKVDQALKFLDFELSRLKSLKLSKAAGK